VDFPDPVAAARSFLDRFAEGARPSRGAFAVALPVTGDMVKMTNNPWAFSIEKTRAALGLSRLTVVNDFTALAMALPRLKPDDRRQVGAGTAQPNKPIALLGAGTGLGVSGLMPLPGGGWQAISGEGGHVTMAASDDREGAVIRWLRNHHGHCSAERVLSGMGIQNLYQALSAVDGRAADPLEPAVVTERALAGTDPVCVEALSMFCAMLGTVAGNLALTLGAHGGVYVAGGIVPRLGAFFDNSAFRARFVAKGRFASYLDPIPTYVVTHPLPAFVGLHALLDG
ncbi:MAG TPA: glucokinase, partial [Alphaproteobacteria bacterium]|nr:glucokinase [Alphaproteobacteria bacterium]